MTVLPMLKGTSATDAKLTILIIRLVNHVYVIVKEARTMIVILAVAIVIALIMSLGKNVIVANGNTLGFQTAKVLHAGLSTRGLFL